MPCIACHKNCTFAFVCQLALLVVGTGIGLKTKVEWKLLQEIMKMRDTKGFGKKVKTSCVPNPLLQTAKHARDRIFFSYILYV